MRVTNGIPLGCSLFLLVGTVNPVQPLKAARDKAAAAQADELKALEDKVTDKAQSSLG
jgi:hypothetical protein